MGWLHDGARRRNSRWGTCDQWPRDCSTVGSLDPDTGWSVGRRLRPMSADHNPAFEQYCEAICELHE
ncbi:MAG: hypothetical protein AB7V43_19770, partial [Acidimicrobiia bacterium]